VKLRIHGNSLRLRLNQAEVAQFSKTGFVEDAIEFGPTRLAYTLEHLSSLNTPQALYHDGWLRIQVPAADAQKWITTDQVGISGEQTLADIKHLSILIEKDFQCAHSKEQDPFAYPNPLQDPAYRADESTR